MKLAVQGTNEMTLDMAEIIQDSNHEVVCLVSLDKENLPNNSSDIKRFSKEKNINYFETENLNSKVSIKFLKDLNADFFISTWPKIISREVLNIPKYSVIGTHPTELPKNKGRHPLHWMIVLKLKNSKLSFFLMDEGIDSGNILLQEPFYVGNDINDANLNMFVAANSGTKKLLRMLEKKPNFKGIKQSKLYSNTWRKRNEHDITIDPRMNPDMIDQIIRSFSKPYPMARLYVKKGVYLNLISAKILQSKVLKKNWINFEHGYLFKSSIDKLWMKVDGAVVELRVDTSQSNIDTKELKGKKIFPPSYYFC